MVPPDEVPVYLDEPPGGVPATEVPAKVPDKVPAETPDEEDAVEETTPDANEVATKEAVVADASDEEVVPANVPRNPDKILMIATADKLHAEAEDAPAELKMVEAVADETPEAAPDDEAAVAEEAVTTEDPAKVRVPVEVSPAPAEDEILPVATEPPVPAEAEADE